MKKTYDKYQKRAIEATGGYYLVLAPPGCGKTDILAERIVHAKASGIAFEDMLCLTFTNRASRGMRSRIMDKVGAEASSLFVGNIHRFCSRMIFAENLVPQNTSVIDDDDQAEVLSSYAPDYFRHRNGLGEINKNAVKYVADLSAYITQSRLGQSKDVRPDGQGLADKYALAQECEFDPAKVPIEEKALIYALQYIHYKNDGNIIDFEDILILAYEHLSSTDHKCYPWIQVDEVQDLNYLQLAIVDAITSKCATVMYLGDEQQAIFSFMGAKLSLLTHLKERCGANILSLANNYRSPSYLLEVCNTYAAYQLGVDPALLPHAVNVGIKHKYDLALTESVDVDREHGRILAMVKYYLGLDKSDRLAILVSKNAEADSISSTLSLAGISNFKISGRDMFRSTSYKTLTALFSVLANEFNFMAWSRLIYGVGAVKTIEEARDFVTKLKHRMMTPSDLLCPNGTYLQRFIDVYGERELVMFDTETTGLNVLSDEIVQIAAFKVRGGKKVPGSDFDIILETSKEIPAMLGEIPNPLLERYATTEHYGRKEGLEMFLDYIGSSPVLGHNVTYDYLILQNNVEKTLGHKITLEVYDSLHMIKCVKPNLMKYKLEYLLKELHLEGENSHLANEDIEATKSLVDFCVNEAQAMLKRQNAFLQDAKVENVAKRMRVLTPYIESIKEYMYKDTACTGKSISTELRETYNKMKNQKIIKDLGDKFEIFLKFVKTEWEEDIAGKSLYDVICEYIYDITSSVNEGDLINSSELLSDRVFVMTVYKGKGLEFENVVVLGAVNGTYPFYMTNKVLSSPNSTNKEREEAMRDQMEDSRKFYVALSRAKKRLCISYYTYTSMGYKAGVTPFINSIKHLFTFFKG